MADWYYQIKGKSINTSSGFFSSNWTFPPIFVGKVSADNRKLAIEAVNELYGKRFPTRVLQKDLDSNEFLLSIQEIKPSERQLIELFEEKTCKQCGEIFKIIDHYNNHNAFYKGREFCSQECRNENQEVQRFINASNSDYDGQHPPVIYKITNIISGECYIGKTTQAFTLRWYQHFFQCSGSKFHEAIKKSDITEWTFSVIERVNIPFEIKTKAAIDKLISDRERYWITYHNAVEAGYNSI